MNLLAPRGRLQFRIGGYISRGHKIWPWRFVSEQNTLLLLRGETLDVYSPAIGPEYNRRPNCWMINSIDIPAEDHGEICSIQRNHNSGIVNITSHTPQCRLKTPPQNFWAVIEEWGELWIWDNLKVVGGTEWLEQSIANNSCLAVTDGSYMKKVYPNITQQHLSSNASREVGVL